MHISYDCATQHHHECDGMRQVVRNSTQLAMCECPCHGQPVETETQLRAAEQLLTGQEA